MRDLISTEEDVRVVIEHVFCPKCGGQVFSESLMSGTTQVLEDYWKKIDEEFLENAIKQKKIEEKVLEEKKRKRNGRFLICVGIFIIILFIMLRNIYLLKYNILFL